MNDGRIRSLATHATTHPFTLLDEAWPLSCAELALMEGDATEKALLKARRNKLRDKLPQLQHHVRPIKQAAGAANPHSQAAKLKKGPVNADNHRVLVEHLLRTTFPATRGAAVAWHKASLYELVGQDDATGKPVHDMVLVALSSLALVGKPALRHMLVEFLCKDVAARITVELRACKGTPAQTYNLVTEYAKMRAHLRLLDLTHRAQARKTGGKSKNSPDFDPTKVTVVLAMLLNAYATAAVAVLQVEHVATLKPMLSAQVSGRAVAHLLFEVLSTLKLTCSPCWDQLHCASLTNAQICHCTKTTTCVAYQRFDDV